MKYEFNQNAVKALATAALRMNEEFFYTLGNAPTLTDGQMLVKGMGFVQEKRGSRFFLPAVAIDAENGSGKRQTHILLGIHYAHAMYPEMMDGAQVIQDMVSDLAKESNITLEQPKQSIRGGVVARLHDGGALAEALNAAM